jgi:hypothetical protein
MIVSSTLVTRGVTALPRRAVVSDLVSIPVPAASLAQAPTPLMTRGDVVRLSPEATLASLDAITETAANQLTIGEGYQRLGTFGKRASLSGGILVADDMLALGESAVIMNVARNKLGLGQEQIAVADGVLAGAKANPAVQSVLIFLSAGNLTIAVLEAYDPKMPLRRSLPWAVLVGALAVLAYLVWHFSRSGGSG